MGKESFIINRINSIKYAMKGAKELLKENSIYAQLILFTIFTIIGFWVGINRFEWMIQLFCFGLILSIEGLNTAIENLCDFVHPDFNHKIGTVKDISAGAVTFAAIFSFIIGCIIYYPYLFPHGLTF